MVFVVWVFGCDYDNVPEMGKRCLWKDGGWHTN